MASSTSANAKTQPGSVAAKSSYLSDSIAEVKKITFPTKQETMQATMVTLVIVAVVSLCLFVLDIVFNQLMSAVLT